MYIGVDVGGTNIAAGLIDENGKILFQTSVPTQKQNGYDFVVDNIVSVIMKLQSHVSDIGNDNVIKAIGIGIPGVVSSDLKTVLYCPNLEWSKCNLADDISSRISDEKLSKYIFADNDANLAAIAELEVGALKGANSAVMITLGTGIGGGIVSDGKILRGNFGLGCEVGHMIIGENFYDCNCGNNGCFETFASASAVVRYANELLTKDEFKNSKGYDYLQQINETKSFGAKEVMELAKQGDSLGMEVLNRLVKYLSIGIVNIIHMIDPERIAIGGGLSNAGDFLFDRVNAQIAKKHFIKGYPFAEIVSAKLGNDAGIVGAGMLAKQEIM